MTCAGKKKKKSKWRPALFFKDKIFKTQGMYGHLRTKGDRKLGIFSGNEKALIRLLIAFPSSAVLSTNVGGEATECEVLLDRVSEIIITYRAGMSEADVLETILLKYAKCFYKQGYVVGYKTEQCNRLHRKQLRRYLSCYAGIKLSVNMLHYLDEKYIETGGTEGLKSYIGGLIFEGLR